MWETPVVVLLWDYLLLVEDEEMQTARRDLQAVRDAGLVNLALTAPKRLAEEDERLRAHLRALAGERADDTTHAHAMQERARAMIARIQRSGALSDVRAN